MPGSPETFPGVDSGGCYRSRNCVGPAQDDVRSRQPLGVGIGIRGAKRGLRKPGAIQRDQISLFWRHGPKERTTLTGWPDSGWACR